MADMTYLVALAIEDRIRTPDHHEPTPLRLRRALRPTPVHPHRRASWLATVLPALR